MPKNQPTLFDPASATPWPPGQEVTEGVETFTVLRERDRGVVYWQCGDDYCDCSCLHVKARYDVRITKVTAAVLPEGYLPPLTSVVREQSLWRGEFHTDGERPTMRELRELRRQCHRLGAPVPDWLREAIREREEDAG